MKFKYIFLSVSLSLFTISCSDRFLEDVPPTDTVIGIGNAIVTKEDLKTAVNGLYASMNSATCFGANHQTYQELTADAAFVGTANSGRFTGTNGWGHISPSEGAGTGIWNNLYNIIANANLILEYEGKISNEGDGEDVTQLFAHAHAIRAYCYTTLMQYFGANYGDGDQSLGVPYPTVFDIYQKLGRSTVQEVYDGILADLDYANQNFTSNPGINKFNPEAVKLLTARVYLYMKNYPAAIQYAEDVLNSSTPLLPMNKVSSYFLLSSESTQDETLFQIYESTTVNLGSNDAISGTWSSAGTYKQNWMTEAFYKTFIPKTNPDDPNGEWPRAQWTAKATDVRAKYWYSTNAYVNGLSDDPKPINVSKYISPARDVILFRKSEAIFIKAEAQYHTAPADAAATLQDWVKTYRDTSYTIPVTSGEGLLDEILRQKGFEFFLEGHRLTDLKRNHKPVDKTVQTGNTFIAPADYYKFIWPVPLPEMQTNQNITQAPGY